MKNYDLDVKPCEICKHYKPDDKGVYGCEKWDCEPEEIDEVKDDDKKA